MCVLRIQQLNIAILVRRPACSPLAVVASELTLGATAHADTQGAVGAAARRPSSRQANIHQEPHGSAEKSQPHPPQLVREEDRARDRDRDPDQVLVRAARDPFYTKIALQPLHDRDQGLVRLEHFVPDHV